MSIFEMEELTNLKTVVLLHWFVLELQSKAVFFDGDVELIKKYLRQGNKLKDSYQTFLKELNDEIDIDISEETVACTFQHNGSPVYTTFLSVGIETENLNTTFAVKFAIKNIEKKLALSVPPLNFKLFYLPPLPIIIPNEAYIMLYRNAFTNIKKHRIEVNIFNLERYFKKMFRSIVHEIIHICLLDESSKKPLFDVEILVNAYVDFFFDKCRTSISKNKFKIFKSLRTFINQNRDVFKKIDKFLSQTQQISLANTIVESFEKFFEDIKDGKITTIPLK